MEEVIPQQHHDTPAPLWRRILVPVDFSELSEEALAAEAIIRRAPCPVLTLRERPQEAKELCVSLKCLLDRCLAGIPASW